MSGLFGTVFNANSRRGKTGGVIIRDKSSKKNIEKIIRKGRIMSKASITVEYNKKAGEINPFIYGFGFEDFAGAVTRGLDAQMLDGRSFEEDDVNRDGVSDKWLPIGWGNNTVRIRRDGRGAFHGDYSQKIEMLAYTDGEIGIRQGELFIEKGKSYTCSLYLKQRELTDESSVNIYLAEEKNVYARYTISVDKISSKWAKYTFTLISSGSSTEAEFRITLAGKGNLWIDQVSLIPEDTYKGHGTRKDIMEKIIELKPNIVRWPGGCIAECYRWKYGIGDIDKRRLLRKYHASVRTKEDPSWDSNSFGTDEFMQFCRDIGATPLLTINIGYDIGDNVDEYLQEALDWVEYCNGDTTTEYGSLRAENGHPEPYNVEYWGLGNEPWGMKAEEYSERYIKFTKALREKDPNIKLIACGGYAYDDDWNRKVLKIAGDYMDSLNLHYYYMDDDYSGTVAEPVKYEEYLIDLKKRIPSLVPGKDVKISILEWNSNDNWKDANKFKQGLYAASFFNIVERQNDIVEHAIVWPALRRIQSLWNHPSDQGLIWFDNHRTYLSPTALAFQLYRQHYAPELIHSTVECDTFNAEQISNVPYLDAVATRDREQQTLILKVVNKSIDQEIPTEISLTGLSSENLKDDIQVSTLTSPDVFARNDLDHPDTVKIVESTLKAQEYFTCVFPPHSATVMRIALKK